MSINTFMNIELVALTGMHLCIYMYFLLNNKVEGKNWGGPVPPWPPRFQHLCLKWLSSCSAVKEKEHIRVKLTCKAWQILDKLTVKILSKYMRHVFNWRCVLDCAVSDRPKKILPAQIPLSNRYDILSCDDLEESRSEFDEVSLSMTNIKKLNSTYHRFRLGSWNVQGLNCTCKQVEIGEILHKNNIDLLAV